MFEPQIQACCTCTRVIVFYHRRRYILILLAPSLIVCMYLNNYNVARDVLKHIWRHKLDMHVFTFEYHYWFKNLTWILR